MWGLFAGAGFEVVGVRVVNGRMLRGLLFSAAVLVVVALFGVTGVDAAGEAGGPVSSSGYRPAAGFVALEYSVPYFGRLWSDHASDRPDTYQAAATVRAQYVGQIGMVERDDPGLDWSFAVEGQSETPGYVTCDETGTCKEVTVRVTSQGLLYLYVPRNTNKSLRWFTHLGGFPRRSLELSASDADSGLKVYREVMLSPSPAASGCEDYGDDTPEAFTCLFLRQLLPDAQAYEASTNRLQSRLPGLVQDRSNYRLVFEEKFDGDPPAADASGCRNGLSTLDDSIWNYYDACLNLDSRGDTCSNVEDGAFVLGVAGVCGKGSIGSADLNTYGNLHFKYGYLEYKYTFNQDRWHNIYYNLNLILYTHGQKLRYLRDRYGVEIHDAEDLLKHAEVEIDTLEAPGLYEFSGQWFNWDYYNTGLTPLVTTKFANYCGVGLHSHINVDRRSCKPDGSFTVTRGIEWTPRGYRTFIKVVGVHNHLTIVPKDFILIQHKPNGVDQSYVTARDRYFEYLVPGDLGSLLEKVAIGHIPLPIATSSWGYMDHRHPYIRTRMKIDYIRVWQPENHYSDMEPVYQ